MAINSFLYHIPSEWGIIDTLAKTNFKDETILQGPPPRVGWYARKGTNEYQAMRQSDYQYVPYGLLALNAISQGSAGDLPAAAPPWSLGHHGLG